jgi:hypothetical protein
MPTKQMQIARPTAKALNSVISLVADLDDYSPGG